MSNTTTPPQLAAIVAAGLFALSLTGCQKDKGTPAPGDPAVTTQAPAQSPAAGSSGETAPGKSAKEHEFEKWKSAILGDAGTRAEVEAECNKMGMEAMNLFEASIGADRLPSNEELEGLDPMQCRALRDIRLAEHRARHPGSFPDR